MKKIVLAILPLLLITAFVHAQNRVVTGTVTDEKGIAAEAVEVKILGTKYGTMSDAYGNYRLANVGPNSTLSFTGQGIITKQVSTGVVGRVNVIIFRQDAFVDCVIVPASNVRKSIRCLGYPASAMSSANAKPNLYQGSGPPFSLIITGVVRDQVGQPLQGISVRVASTQASTATDSAGRYRIYAAADTCSLLFETDDMWPVKESVAGRSKIDMKLDAPPGAAYEALRKLRYESALRESKHQPKGGFRF